MTKFNFQSESSENQTTKIVITDIFGNTQNVSVLGAKISIEGDTEKVNLNIVPAPSVPPPVKLKELPNSDEYLRYICVAGQTIFDLAKTKPEATKANMIYGVRYHYLTDPNVSANGDPYEGLAAPGEIVPNVRDVYDSLMKELIDNNPKTVVGTYLGSLSLQDKDKMKSVGFYPTQAAHINHFDTGCVNPPLVTSPMNNGTIKVDDEDCRNVGVEVHNNIGTGKESREKYDLIHYDEVGWTTAWAHNVDRLTRMKKYHNENGVNISFTLGGYPWVGLPSVGIGGIPGLGQNTLNEVLGMGNSVQLEGFLSLNPGISPYGFRTKTLMENAIMHLRYVLDAGMAVEFLPLPGNQHTCSKRNVVSITESDVGTRLFITTDGESNIFPHGGVPNGKIKLEGLPSNLKFLEQYNWNPIDTGNVNQVKLSTTSSLATIKKQNNFTGTISSVGGRIVDHQSDIRFLAAFATLIRNPGHKIYVHYSPQSSLPGNGVETDIDCWFSWSKQLGNPIEDYKIEKLGEVVTIGSTWAGSINMMGDKTPKTDNVVELISRKFEKGTLSIYPKLGHVKVVLNK